MWHHISVLHLTENMRLNHNSTEREFAQWLLSLGHGSTVDLDTGTGSISIPSNMVCEDKDSLIQSLYRSMPHTSTPSPQYCYDRVLLAPLNDDVQKLNTHILQHFPGLSRTYTSADT